jgi:hypothetical protein
MPWVAGNTRRRGLQAVLRLGGSLPSVAGLHIMAGREGTHKGMPLQESGKPKTYLL